MAFYFKGGAVGDDGAGGGGEFGAEGADGGPGGGEVGGDVGGEGRGWDRVIEGHGVAVLGVDRGVGVGVFECSVGKWVSV